MGWWGRLKVRSAALVARRSAPVGVLAASSIAVTVLVLLAAWRPAALWPLHGAGLALVLGASAWCADDRLAPLVDVSPSARPDAARVRASGPLALVALWAVLHAARRHALPPHLPLLVGQGAAVALVGMAVGAHQRRAGRSSGGARAAQALVPVLVGWALVRPWADRVPLHPLWPWDPWGRAALLWGAVGLAATASLIRAVRAGR